MTEKPEPDGEPEEPDSSSGLHVFLELIKGDLGLQSLDVDVVFLSSQEIQELNKTFRNKDQPTDVLSFPQCQWNEPLQRGKPPNYQIPSWEVQPSLGDIAICPAIASLQAKDLNHSLWEELAFLIVHGLLHLCGHDHETIEEEKLMLAQQKLLMAKIRENCWWKYLKGAHL